MPQDMLIASAGDDIKLWDCNGYGLVQQFNPHAHNISSICWSQDNTTLASASTCGDKIVLTQMDGTASSSYELAVGENRQVIAFNSMSRYIMGGGPDGIIHVWDLKTRKFKKSYKDHKSAITAIQFNWNDTMIASGSESGEIILYNVVNGLASAPLSTPKSQAIREVKYSNFRKSLLAACSDSGIVSLWDTHKRAAVHSFRDSHTAPSSSLAFSPINEMLLMSVGLDRRVVCYDVRNKQSVKTMTAESPLTSVDILNDGATLAAGSTRGKIFVFDLRHGAQPLTTVNTAHKASVQCVKFQNSKSKLGGSGCAPASKSSSSMNNNNELKSHTNNNNGLGAAENNKERQGANNEKMSTFSGSSSNLHASSGQSAGGQLSSGDLPPTAKPNSSYNSDLFSPVRDRQTEKYNYANKNESLFRRVVMSSPDMSNKTIHITERKRHTSTTDQAAALPDTNKSDNNSLTVPESRPTRSSFGDKEIFSPLEGARSIPIGGATDISLGSRPINSSYSSDLFPGGSSSNIFSQPTSARSQRDFDEANNFKSSQESLDSSVGFKTTKKSLSPPPEQHELVQQSQRQPSPYRQTTPREPQPSSPYKQPSPRKQQPSPRRMEQQQQQQHEEQPQDIENHNGQMNNHVNRYQDSYPALPYPSAPASVAGAAASDGAHARASTNGAGAIAAPPTSSSSSASASGGGCPSCGTRQCPSCGSTGGALGGIDSPLVQHLEVMMKDIALEVQDKLHMDILRAVWDINKSLQIKQAETQQMIFQQSSVINDLVSNIEQLKAENEKLKRGDTFY